MSCINSKTSYYVICSIPTKLISLSIKNIFLSMLLAFLNFSMQALQQYLEAGHEHPFKSVQ